MVLHQRHRKTALIFVMNQTECEQIDGDHGHCISPITSEPNRGLTS